MSEIDQTKRVGVLAIVPYAYPDANALRVITDHLKSRYRVQLGHLQGTGTDLSGALERLVLGGCQEILAISLCQPLDASLSIWLPGALSSMANAHPQVDVHWVTPEKQSSDFSKMLAQLLDEPERHHKVRDQPAILSNPGWQYPLQRRWHLLVCNGPRCKLRGATQLQRVVRRWLKQHDIEEDDPINGVQMTGCQCLFPCNQGPLMIVNPGDTWYAALQAEDVAAVLEKHLLHGHVVTEKLIEQDPTTQPESAA
ncbi:MAG: (2Fe-2S) ferredoxin domain-containing protein [Pseudomonadota bacterium]